MYKRRLVVLVLIVVLVSACGAGSSAERAGEWRGATDFGTFVFVVNADGTTVTRFEYDVQTCSAARPSQGTSFSGVFELPDGVPIEDGAFALGGNGPPWIEFKGEFDRNATRASGTWKAGRCSGEWEIER